MSRYFRPMDAVYDSIDARIQKAYAKRQNEIRQESETKHFINVVQEHLAKYYPSIQDVISKWPKDKAPAYGIVQILGCRKWNEQEETDVNLLYRSFDNLSKEIFHAQKEYGEIPEVMALIEEFRNSTDVRLIPFKKRLDDIIKRKK